MRVDYEPVPLKAKAEAKAKAEEANLSLSLSLGLLCIAYHIHRKKGTAFSADAPMALNPLQRLFGSGPRIHLTSLVLFGVVYLVQERFNPPLAPIPTPLNYWLAGGILGIGLALASGIFLWTYRLLGRQLVTRGPYKYVRHPIYAVILSTEWLGAFLVFRSVFVGVACAISYALAHQWIRYEEGLLQREFGKIWDEYAAQTGRFFPRCRF